MTIAGLPLHPLVVHAAVVLIPLAALLAIGFALLPGWRWLLRWPTAAAAVVSVGLAYLATSSGESLAESRPGLEEAIGEHAERGDLLAAMLIPFAILLVAAAWSMAGASGLASGRGAQESRIPVLEKVFPPVIVLASLGILVLVVLVGDSGARSVWGG